ncbi:MAG TPA: hypothetical protein VMU89_24050 [Thermomicrobiaceae bacterium]|nr:hypothetical protein [Thermomicrobiaceae bacterium]
MGIWGNLILILAALVLVSPAWAARSRLGYEWIVIEIGADSAESAHLSGLGTRGPAVDGLHVVPALLDAALAAAVPGALLAVFMRPTAPS